MKNHEKKDLGKTSDEKKLKIMCVCAKCPTYVNCKELAFCLETVGKSKCIKDPKGCLCPSCPVESLMGFKHAYYCTKGSEKELISKK
jgi:hypothetical protein